MNAPVTAEAAETQKIENALDALLSAAIAADRDPALVAERGAVEATAVAREVIERLSTWTKAQRTAADLYTRPVSEICRQGVTTLGRRLHEIGGMKLMQDVCYRVAERDPATEARRIGIIDARWDGIGDWYA